MGNEKAHADKKLLNLLNFFMRYARQMAINATTQKFNTNSTSKSLYITIHDFSENYKYCNFKQIQSNYFQRRENFNPCTNNS
jgi:hypothetical protein